MDLKFDKMTVDTALAQCYLDKHKELLVDKTAKQECWTIYPDGTPTSENTLIQSNDLQKALEGLAAELEGNTKLIAQLEYLTRNIPTEDTEAQLNIVVQQVRYVSRLPVDETNKSVLIDYVALNKDSPLLVLGYIAKIFRRELKCTLYAEDTAGPVCHVFTKLCHNAGLPIVTKFSQAEQNAVKEYSKVPEGACGVISEFSDVDSAVDAFLTSSEHVPWRLQKIFVQESVYQQCKNILAWKCKSVDTTPDAVEYNGRVFLIDMVGTKKLQPTAVTVEAYRTKKELKSMLTQYRPYYVSLWANDIAEINDVTHGIHSPVVWVNNFGDFRGPPKVSEAVYSHGVFGLFNPTYSRSVQKDKQVCELLASKPAWLTLSYEVRLDRMSKALDECVTAEPANNEYKEYRNNFKIQSNNGRAAFIDVAKDYVCQGIAAPANELFVFSGKLLGVNLLASILQGNAFLYNPAGNCTLLMDKLKKAGAPVSCLAEANCTTDGDYKIYISDNASAEYTHTIRVIWTNTGTVFAN